MGGVSNFRTISGEELRARIDRLGLTYVEAARRLGLTEDGLYKQMRGNRRVGRQTEIILGFLEQQPKRQRPPRGKGLAQYLYPSSRGRK
jgi:hypothetical protein